MNSEIELRSTSLPASFARNPSERVVKSEERKQTEKEKESKGSHEPLGGDER